MPELKKGDHCDKKNRFLSEVQKERQEEREAKGTKYSPEGAAAPGCVQKLTCRLRFGVNPHVSCADSHGILCSVIFLDWECGDALTPYSSLFSAPSLRRSVKRVQPRS